MESGGGDAAELFRRRQSLERVLVEASFNLMIADRSRPLFRWSEPI
jgi:hypothetical protein